MGEARKKLVEIEQSDYDVAEDAKAERDVERDEAHRRMGEEGMAAARALGAIMSGKKPSRDPNHDYSKDDEPSRVGRARKQPPIIGVRG